MPLVKKEDSFIRDYGNIVTYFDKTPPSIVCPHFWMLKWGSGCPFDCAYCYLKGTFYGDVSPKHKFPDVISAGLDLFFRNEQTPRIVNSGELCDSLMFPSIISDISNQFEEQGKHKLLILTKSSDINWLLEKERKQTIYSATINIAEVINRWEHKTASLKERLEATKALYDVGYEVRVRIDPIFPVDDWKKKYNGLLDDLFSAYVPERITLGTPRGLRKTLRFSKDLSWAQSLIEDSSWGKKLPFDLRSEIYAHFFEEITKRSQKVKVSICKDTVVMWTELKQDFKKCECNCIW